MMRFVLAMSIVALLPSAFAVEVSSLCGEWQFSKNSGKDWTAVTVPHDWAISGPFDPNVAGWSGKLPWKGEGDYRRSFDLSPADLANLRNGGKAYLEFDGVMASPRVKLNGKELGGWDYGYMSFWLDATAAIKPTGNLLEVHCSTKNHNSRWYPGAGIYRAVRLVTRPRNHVLPGTLAITTPKVTPDSATVSVDYESSVDGRQKLEFEVKHPRLWSMEDPHLYEVEVLGERFRYGIRTFEFKADDGFWLNGARVQLNGVDLHSDLGPLGMAFDRDAMKRQLLIMKDMGFNALRTSHNASDPVVLDLCDEMGVFVWNECFDKWDGTAGRTKEQNLEEYIAKNLRQFVRRDRNHPSVFCWSIGNEIGAATHDNAPTGMTTERFRIFRSAIRELDTTRPVCIGCCGSWDRRDVCDFSVLDLTGWNYNALYANAKQMYPKMPLLYSESASAVSEYGFYELPPATGKTGYNRDTMHVGSYDHCAAPWSDIPDVEFDRMQKHRYCAGEFVWTGIDYLGEPTPMTNGEIFNVKTNECETARSSYFGIVDLCGIPKDRFYLYRSHWNRNSETLHILPHWNWSVAKGANVPVYVYTSGDEAELFLNGRSLGRHRKSYAVKRNNLAAGKLATASSVERKAGIVRGPECALNDDMDQRWCASSDKTNEWWQVDFGEKTAFDTLILTEESPGRKYAFAVTLSDDGKTWREYFRQDLAPGMTAPIVKADAARYLRVTFTGMGKGVWASLKNVLVQKSGSEGCAVTPYYDVCSKYRLRWFNVPYEHGELRAVAYRDGKCIGEQVMRTADKPVAVKLTDDPFNPKDAHTRFVQVDLVDAAGTRDPLAMNRVSFRIKGPGKIVAVGNGNPRGYDAFTDVSSHPLYYGKAVAVVRIDPNASESVKLYAEVEGLKGAELTLDPPATSPRPVKLEWKQGQGCPVRYFDFGPDGVGGFPTFEVKSLEGKPKVRLSYACVPACGANGDFTRETSARYLGPSVDLPILPANINRFDVFSVTNCGTYSAALQQGLVRYVRLQLETPGTAVELSNLRLENRGTHSTEPAIGEFSCSDPALTALWQASVRTCTLAAIPARTDTHAYLSDGAKRDRLVWSGDLWWAQPSMYAAFSSQSPYLPGSLRMLAENQTPEGYVQACPYPESHGPLAAGDYGPFASDEFAAWFVPVLYTHYLHTADMQLLQQLYPNVRKLMAYLLSHVREDGVFEQRSETSKHANGLAFGTSSTHHRSFINVLLWRTCRDAASLAKIVGSTDDAEKWTREAVRVSEPVRRRFFRADGLLRASLEDESAGLESNALALGVGFFTAEEAKKVLSVLPRISHGKFQLLTVRGAFAYGDPDEALRRVRQHNWLKIVDPAWKGVHTTSECMNFPTRLSWGDECHPDTAVAGDLTTGVLGIVPLEPGYRRFRFEPGAAKGIDWAKGSVPTPYGMINASWRRKDGKVELFLDCPKETTCESASGRVRRLIWSDEFNGASLDHSKWGFELGFVRNREYQYYTDRPENVRVEQGRLIIEGRREKFPNAAYDAASATNEWYRQRKEAYFTSGSVNTLGKFGFKYGRIECRAKLPKARGCWPAIWTLGTDKPSVSWPKCGEIDIMEHFGHLPGRVTCNLHGYAPKFSKAENGYLCEGMNKLEMEDPTGGFHVYAAEWNAQGVTMYYDEREVGRYSFDRFDHDGANCFRKPHYLLLNLALGAEWMMPKEQLGPAFPQRYEIDWIRIFEH